MGGVVVDGTETAVEGWASDCTAGCFDGVLVAVAAGAEGGAGAVGSGAGDDVLGGDIPREPAESGVTLAEDGAGGATAICFDGAFVAVAAAADGGAGAVGSGADGDVLGGDTPRELADSGVAMVEDWAGGGTAGCFGGALVAVAAGADGGAGAAGSGAGGDVLGGDTPREPADSGIAMVEDWAGGGTAGCFGGALVAVAAGADGGAAAAGSGAGGDVLGEDIPREPADSGIAMVEDWAGGGTAGCFGGALVAVAAAADGGAGVAGSGAGGGILGEDIRPECAESRPVSAAGEELG